MGVLPAILGGALGLFALLWYCALIRLPIRRRPSFVARPFFTWGVPSIAATTWSLSVYIIALTSLTTMIVFVASCGCAAILIGGIDRYAAEMRTIYYQYRKIRLASPAMEEVEVLYHTAEWRYPSWSQDRLLELVAGKDIQALMVLMMIQENQVNPLSDWELYRRLRSAAVRITDRGRGT